MGNLIASFNLEPKDAIEALKEKRLVKSFSYKEVQTRSHNKIFTVAKVMNQDLLADIKQSLDEAFRKGTRFEDWKKKIEPTLRERGWYGKTDVVDPETGDAKTINVNARRLRTIFETNMNVAYATQRKASMDKLPFSVYRRYVCMMLPNSRESHKKMHGTILHKDDPFWSINTPPNGWFCKCKLEAVSEWEIESRGLKVGPAPLDNIADKDWAYNPADPDQWWDNNAVPLSDNQPDYTKYPERPANLSEVTEGRNPAPQILDTGKTQDEALEILSKAIMGDQERIEIQTPVEKVLITKKLLSHAVEKRDSARERYGNYVLPTLEKPYEVWYTQYADGSRRMRYIGLFEGKKSFFAVTLNRDGCVIWNLIPMKDKDLNKQRRGWLTYGK
jgi:SPP1 gp7 family putative phage head morphogenesis protein